jgi:cyanophycin synthetase
MRVGTPQFSTGRVTVTLAFDAEEPLRTSDVPGSADRVLAALPGLRGHRCDNGSGATFAQEVADTEFAHLFEHAALEVMALAGAPDTLKGSTRWDFAADGAGVFRVELEHDDAATARGAIALAGAVVERAAGLRDVAPDVARTVREMRGRRAAAPRRA